ncbi:MAG: ABC transporter permease [Terracidiphilus sp.]|jgi:predicted permease
MGTLIQDLRFALRQLGRAPSFTFTAVITLALGIGANTAIFSLVNALLLKPLPVANPGEIAALAAGQGSGPVGQGFSYPEFQQIRAQVGHSFSAVAAHALGLDGIAMQGQQPQRILTAYVTGNFFSMLGLKPAAGRLLLDSEGEVLGKDPVIVLGYDYWKEKFNLDPSIVGRPVTVDGHPYTIVGVAPNGFSGVQSFVKVAGFIPISQIANQAGTTDVWTNWQNRPLSLFARLQPGVSFKQASSDMGVSAQTLTRLQPEAEKKIRMVAFPEPVMRVQTGDGSTIYVVAGLFLSLAVMVLMLACVNVANLVLVRATSREREMAIRSAMGAKRSRLLRQMITESVTLALIGGVAGVLLGAWASSALGHLDVHADLPVNLSFGFDWRIFFYSFAVALLAGLVVGIVPAVRVAKANVNGVLREGGRAVATGRHWFRDALVAMQIAGSLVLLVVASLFVRSLTAMQSMDFGFKPDQVLNLIVDPGEIGMSPEQSRDLGRTILARLHQLAGVEAVSHASTIPLGYLGNGGDTVTIDGAPPPSNPGAFGVGYTVISPEYFNVMGIGMVRGRGFTEADDEHSRDVAIISESMASKFWPNQDPIGHTFRMAAEKNRKLEVVGIARDAMFQYFGGGKKQPFLYLPHDQHLAGNTLMAIQIRTERDPLALAPTVQKTIHDISSGLPIFQVQTMRQAMYTLNGLLLFQIGASLAALMGGLGLTLAVIGLYGVVSYAVSRRVHEIGLRMALGASRGIVFRMIYRQSVGMVAAGLGIGLALALAIARTVGSFVMVSVWDPWTYVVVALVLAAAALGSTFFPARRAMAIEPMTALREE